MTQIRIAYLLLVHKCPEQVNMFIEQLLRHGCCDVYIHIDSKNLEMRDSIKKDKHVFICSEYDVKWGSFEIIKAAIKLMRIVQASSVQYSHIYFGSGQDLIIKKGIYEFLKLNPENIFLKIVGKVDDSKRESARYRILWPKNLMIRNDMHPYRFVRIAMQLLCRCGIVIRPNKKRLKDNINFYEGRTWFIVPIEVMNYLLEYIDSNSLYVDFWEESLASDLMFFQTIIMNSSFACKVKDELMYVNFGKTFRTMNHPLTITMNNIDEIEKNNFFYARKFELNKDKNVIKYFKDKI